MATVTANSPRYNPPSAEQILKHVGIQLPSYRPGTRRLTCPQCSPKRKPSHQKLKCLTVEIRPDDTCVWCCHHPGCGFSGPRAEHVKGINGTPYVHRATPQPVKQDAWQPMLPPPPDHRSFDPPRNLTALYRYRDMDGNILCYVSRRDLVNGKDIFPHTYGSFNGREGWYVRRGPPPLPLYGLRLLATAPADFDVFLVEGEKAADALNKKLRSENYAAFAMTWMGGADNVEYADWQPLQGRNVILWPDADLPGATAMMKAGKSLNVIATVRTDGLPEGFDAADIDTELGAFLQKRCR